MEKISQNKKTGNVLSIADNSKFTNRKLISVGRGANPDEFVTFTLGANRFGLAEGDSLICTTEFSSDEIQEDSLVIIETESGYALTAAASIDNSRIFAVVKRFQREL